MAIYSWFSHWKWWFSIAMLGYQRVLAEFMAWASLIGWLTGERVIDVLTFGALSSDKPHTMPWRQEHLWRCPKLPSVGRDQVWISSLMTPGGQQVNMAWLVFRCFSPRLPWPGYATSASGANAGDGIIQLVVQFHRGQSASGFRHVSAGDFRMDFMVDYWEHFLSGGWIIESQKQANIRQTEVAFTCFRMI